MLQRSPAWHAIRAGRVGGSEAKAVVSTLKNGGESAARRDLRTQKALEHLGVTVATSTYLNADMIRGLEREESARAAFEIATGCVVTPVGYVSSEHLAAGCSPDGFVGSESMIEIKCPRPANHWATWKLREKTGLDGVPRVHHPQILHALAITGRDSLTYISYCLEMPAPLALYTQEIYLYDLTDQIATYLEQLTAFCAEVTTEATAITTLVEDMGHPVFQIGRIKGERHA